MITVILLAAGKGSRTTFSDNKIKYNLKGLPVFMHSYKLFNKLGYNIITVIRKEDEEFILNYIDTPITYGGETRLESVENGLKLVNSKYVLIHDGARPFISEEVVLELVESLKRFDASMVCKKATSTFYDTNLEVVDRNNLIEAETPQAFLTSKIKEAFSNRLNDSYTDDISLYKSYYKDEKIGLVYHTTNNEKLTTKEQMESHMEQGYKIGHAYDIHKLVKDRKLILAGVHIDHLYGLLGHSDADVVYHAVAESILGALGLGDLGTHFPDTDLKYKDLNSKEIMLYVKDKCEKLDYEIVNLDVSIYAEEPKLAPYIKQMKKNIAEALNINVNQVNVKAGTNETLDAVGKKEAIASESVCLLKVYIK